MATIEERATKYADLAKKQEFFDNRIKEVAANFAYSHYTIGATEQRDIDIEKATEWLNANWRKYIDTDADGMMRFSGWKNDFRKAMTEQ